MTLDLLSFSCYYAITTVQYLQLRGSERKHNLANIRDELFHCVANRSSFEDQSLGDISSLVRVTLDVCAMLLLQI